jgi:hypothetical protein
MLIYHIQCILYMEYVKVPTWIIHASKKYFNLFSFFNIIKFNLKQTLIRFSPNVIYLFFFLIKKLYKKIYF